MSPSLADRTRVQADHCRAAGSPLTADLLVGAADDLDAGGILADLLGPLPGRRARQPVLAGRPRHPVGGSVAASGRAVRIVERLGCDPDPLDPTRTEDRLTLTSYVWADQRSRLDGCGVRCRSRRRTPCRSSARQPRSSSPRAGTPGHGPPVVWR